MPISHTKPFGIYHWDTFDGETFLIGQTDSLEDAIKFVEEQYDGRIRSNGADQVDIVDLHGNIIKKFAVG